MKYQKLVLGFAFNEEKTHVVLIRKNRPEWMSGKLNGVGGKLEAGEYPTQAMSREFYEEAGISIPNAKWMQFGMFTENSENENEIYCYKTIINDLDNIVAKTDEEIVIVEIDNLHKRQDTLDNVPWLVHMALASKESEHILMYFR